MPLLYNISLGEIKGKALLTSRKEVASLLYHDLFGFPLTAGELIKWSAGEKAYVPNWEERRINSKGGYYFLGDDEAVVYKRLLKKRISRRKIRIAKKAARILSLIPFIKAIAVTGALAMENAADENDIDLLIITKKGRLWTSRFLVYFVLCTLRFALRRPKDKQQKDKLCLNMWLDEGALSWDWHDRNIYTAHEIAQIKPLLNKDKTYEKFIAKNAWIHDYWPNAVKIKNYLPCRQAGNSKFKIIEHIAYKLQLWYMKPKITREVVTPHKALFHPNDWGKVVLQQLTS